MRRLRRLLAWAVARAVLGNPAAADDVTETIDAMSHEAGQRGRLAEVRYLLQEAGSLVREGLARHERRQPGPRGILGRWWDAGRDDLRTAVRLRRQRPAATAGLVATVAAAVATVTIAYGLAAAVLWRPLPFPDADRLVFAWQVADTGEPYRATSGRFHAWRRSVPAFEELALFGAAGFALEGADGSRPIRGVRVSANYFDVLGIAPHLGRAFTVSDESPGQHRVVVLSWGAWQRRLGGRADVVGLEVRFSGEPYTVVGVMPDVATPGWPAHPARVAFDPAVREFWVPIARTPALEANTKSHVFGVLGRLRPGISRLAADAALAAVTMPDDGADGAATLGYRDQFAGDARAPLQLLLMAALAVLLVATGNLAALHVASFESRRGDFAMRAALGAGRLRLAGQIATDALLVAGVGGVVGLALARVALAGLPALLPPSIPFLTPATLDGAVLRLGCGVVAAVAGLLVIWPLARLATVAPVGRGVVPSARSVTYRSLVAAQVALSVGLASPAVLLTRSLLHLRAEEAALAVEGVVAASVGVPEADSRSLDRVVAFNSALLDALAVAPGVSGTALAYDHPLDANWSDAVTVEGDTTEAGARRDALLRIVSPNYFDAMRVAVVEGRAFTDVEGLGRPGAVVVNEAFAASISGRVLGRRLRSQAARYTWGAAVPDTFEIVGVVQDERFRGLEAPSAPALYLSTRQFPQASAQLLVRAAGDGRAVAASLRGVIRQSAPAATIGPPRLLSDILGEQLAPRRLTTEVVSGFALVSLLLTSLGVYGLLALVVATSARDMGVRLALGASPLRVAGRVVWSGLACAGAGVAAGIALAWATGGLVEHLVVGVAGRDVATVAGVAITVLVVSVVAAVLPARRAARLDPAVVLKPHG